MLSVEIPIKIQFYDLDPMNIVWHGNYARYFEEVRCELLEKIGYNYDEMQRSGYIWPIVTMETKYIRSIHFFQEILVTATLREYQNRLKIEYIIRDKKTGEVLTKAHTIQVAVKIDTNELCLESPPALVNKIKAIQ